MASRQLSFSRPTQRQMEALVELLERNPGIARGLLRTQQGKHETRAKWQEFATAANALGGVTKDGPGWSKYWGEKKYAIRTRCQQQAPSMTRTGGGVDFLPMLTLLEQRLVAVMGGQSFATGDRGLAVNPFPNNSSQPSSTILDQPSTSSAAEELFLATDDQVQDPAQAPAEASQQVETSPQGETGRTATHRSPRLNRSSRRSESFLDTQVRRFEEIETRRVDGERQTAEALSQIAAAFREMVDLLRVVLERDRRAGSSPDMFY